MRRASSTASPVRLPDLSMKLISGPEVCTATRNSPRLRMSDSASARAAVVTQAAVRASAATPSHCLIFCMLRILFNDVKPPGPNDAGRYCRYHHNDCEAARALRARVLQNLFQEGLRARVAGMPERSEEHTSELQSLMRSSYAVFCLKKKIYEDKFERNDVGTQQH